MKKYCKYCYKNTEHLIEEYFKCEECGANNYKIDKIWKNRNNIFSVSSIEGKWTPLVKKYLGKGEDRLYLVDSNGFAISHEQQLFLIERKLKNDAKPKAFWENFNLYQTLLDEIKAWRKGIDENI